MTAARAEAAADFLVASAEQLMVGSDAASIRAIMTTACGGRIDSLRPDGRRASGLTAAGVPFEVSVTGGLGECEPAIRYTTEPGTHLPTFALHLEAQLAAIRDLVRSHLPDGSDATGELLKSFVATLYPEPEKVSMRQRFATWIGVVHHSAIPGRVARLKVYGSASVAPSTLSRLRSRWPEFSELTAVPECDPLLRYTGASVEVDAYGEITHKIYMTSRYRDVGVPMKLVRHFGDPAWQILSEMVRCGVDPAELHRHKFFVCCSQHNAGSPSLALYLMAGRRTDLTTAARQLAEEHHGSTAAVDVLTQAAQTSGGQWRYSGIGLGHTADRGIDKLNVYGTPTWGKT